eukprot:maker-scaffold220_size252247-snap-gene-0.14 protein:Tk01516 transcript:maker-scaffold220_size252247-snap-gene-0.14-mRNA-1 annotation:"hypothetical protein Y032_0038g3590"
MAYLGNLESLDLLDAQSRAILDHLVCLAHRAKEEMRVMEGFVVILEIALHSLHKPRLRGAKVNLEFKAEKETRLTRATKGLEDLLDHLDLRGIRDFLENLANMDSQGNLEKKAFLDHKEILVCLEHLHSRVEREAKENPEYREERRDSQDCRAKLDLLEILDKLDSQDRREIKGRKAYQDCMGSRVTEEIPDQLDLKALQGRQDRQGEMVKRETLDH